MESVPAREDYPATLLALEARFPSEEACRAYLADLRWPAGFRCPRCGSGRSWPKKRHALMECVACHYQVSPTAGTIFHRSRIPLRVWFRMIWLVTSQKNGASALNVQRQLGLNRYETVWTLLHKLRRAMVRPDRDRLAGKVEVDETYVGGEDPEVRGRESGAKALVAVAAEEDGRGIGRIRLCRIPDASRASLLPFVEQAVTPGSVVHTDAWEGYGGLAGRGYHHEVTSIRGSGKPGHEVLPRVHQVASLLKRWWLGTHQGAIGSTQLDYYLDEFTFRFNRRKSRSRGKLFFRLLQNAVQVEPVYWVDVARGARSHTGDHKMLGLQESTG